MFFKNNCQETCSRQNKNTQMAVYCLSNPNIITSISECTIPILISLGPSQTLLQNVHPISNPYNVVQIPVQLHGITVSDCDHLPMETPWNEPAETQVLDISEHQDMLNAHRQTKSTLFCF